MPDDNIASGLPSDAPIQLQHGAAHYRRPDRRGWKEKQIRFLLNLLYLYQILFCLIFSVIKRWSASYKTDRLSARRVLFVRFGSFSELLWRSLPRLVYLPLKVTSVLLVQVSSFSYGSLTLLLGGVGEQSENCQLTQFEWFFKKMRWKRSNGSIGMRNQTRCDRQIGCEPNAQIKI